MENINENNISNVRTGEGNLPIANNGENKPLIVKNSENDSQIIKTCETDLLIVIDMQNVYRPGNEWGCESFDQAVSSIRETIEKFPKANVAFTKFIADENPAGVWKNYNEENKAINDSQYLNDITEELSQYVTDDNLYVKSTYSSLKNPDLRKQLDLYNRVFVAGVVAECCVLSTIFELIDCGKKIYYIKDAVAGENSTKESAVTLALEGLSPLHIEFIKSADIIK